ncbi:hypothetical protein JD844_001464, partial [Phrynosoma platyrhinos]
MENQPLEVIVISSQGGHSQKRPAPISEEDRHVYKRVRRDSPVYPMEWESYPPPPEWTHLALLETSAKEATQPLETEEVQSERKNLKLRLQEVQPERKTLQSRPQKVQPKRKTVKPSPQQAPSPQQRPSLSGVDVIPLLRRTLSAFPFGLRLDKLEKIVWKDHKVRLCRMSLEYGYRDSLRFLEAVPGIRIKLPSKGTSQYLVQWDPG